MYYSDFVDNGEYLCHHGVKGMRWGVRRYQNEDGTLTRAGIRRYGNEDTRTARQWTRMLNDESHGALAAEVNSKIANDEALLWKQKKIDRENKGKELKERHKKILDTTVKNAEEYLKASEDMRKNIDSLISKVPKDLKVNSKIFNDTVFLTEAKFSKTPFLMHHPEGWHNESRRQNRTTYTIYTGNGYYTHYSPYKNTKYKVTKNKES